MRTYKRCAGAALLSQSSKRTTILKQQYIYNRGALDTKRHANRAKTDITRGFCSGGICGKGGARRAIHFCFSTSRGSQHKQGGAGVTEGSNSSHATLACRSETYILWVGTCLTLVDHIARTRLLCAPPLLLLPRPPSCLPATHLSRTNTRSHQTESWGEGARCHA